MNNIKYNIKEKNNINYINNNINDNIDDDINNNLIYNNNINYINDNINNDNEILAQQINYNLNYSLKYINNIMDYYEIKKTKLNKKQMIEEIVKYENNSENYLNVIERKKLFDIYIELKNNKFFSKFIITKF